MIGNSVTSIGSYAFSFCASLTSVTIPSSVTSIGSDAFSHCTSLTSVTIPSSVTSIGYDVFRACSSLTSMTVDTNNLNYSSEAGCLFDKDKKTLIQYPIGNTASSYVIPNSVTSIGNSAFYLCSSLTSVTIPNSVTSIGSGAFYQCTNLTDLTIPSSVTSIDSSAFSSCSSLTSVTIPSSMTSIEFHTFSYCSGLTSVTIPSSITSIGDYAFDSCYNLSDVYYSGTQEEWNEISISHAPYNSSYHGNYYLTSATIHYNNTGPEDVGGNVANVLNGSVYALTQFDGEMVYFDDSDFGCDVLTGTDTTAWADLVGKYVIVTLTDDGFLLNQVESLTPVDHSGIAVLEDVDTTLETFTLNGMTYPFSFPDNFLYDGTLDFYKGSTLFYHLKDNQVIGFSNLYSETFTIAKAAGHIAVVTEEEDIFYISTFLKDSFDISQLVGQQVTVYCSRNNLIYGLVDVETVTGSITGLDYSNDPLKVTVDSTEYSLACDLDGVGLFSEVFCLVVDGEIRHIDFLSNIDMVTNIVAVPRGSFVYANKGFTPESITTKLQISYNYDYDFSEYPEYKIDKIFEDDYFIGSKGQYITSATISTSDSKFNLSQDGFDFGQEYLLLGNTLETEEITIRPNTSYAPIKSKEYQNFYVTLLGLLDTELAQCTLQVSVTHQELADQEAADKEEEEQAAKDEVERLKTLAACKSELNDEIDIFNSTQLTLGTLGNLINNSTVESSVSSALLFWIAAMSCEVEDTFFSSLLNEVPEKLKDAYLEEVKDFWGFYFKGAYSLSSTVASAMDLGIKKIDGAELFLEIPIGNSYQKVKFTYSGTCYSYQNTDLGSLGEIDWVYVDEKNKEQDVSGLCVSVSTNANGFVNKMYSITESMIAYTYEQVVKDYRALCGDTLNLVADSVFGRIGMNFVSQSTYKILGSVTAKNLTVNCPVDVYFYDMEGELVGSIVDDTVIDLGNDSLVMSVEGSKKLGTMTEDFQLSLVSTGTGSMYYEVQEVALENDGTVEEVLRTVVFEAVPLEEDLDYTSYVSNNVFESVETYDLIASDYSIVTADSDDYADKPVYEKISSPTVDSFEVLYEDNTVQAKATFTSEHSTIDSAVVLYTTVTEVISQAMTESDGQWLDSFTVPDNMKNTSISIAAVVTDALGNPEISDVITLDISDTSYTVTFHTNGGTAISPQVITELGTATEPTAPTKDGYTFEGWYTDSEWTTAFDFDTAITENRTLYAKWTKISGGTEEDDDTTGDTEDDDTTGDTENDNSSGTGSNSSGNSSSDGSSNGSGSSSNGTYGGTTEEEEDTETEDDTSSETPDNTVNLQVPVIKSMLSSTFTDIDTSTWYYNAVKYVYERGLMSGTGDGKFSPELATSRGMIVQVLYNIAGQPSATGTNFSDVATDAWYAKAVAWASYVGVASGTGNGNFNPNGDMTREQLVVMLYGFEKLMTGESYTGSTSLSFTDTSSVSSWAVEATAWAVSKGLVAGNPDGTFAPQGSAQRCQVAQILTNFVEMYS